MEERNKYMRITESKLRSIIKSVIAESESDDIPSGPVVSKSLRRKLGLEKRVPNEAVTAFLNNIRDEYESSPKTPPKPMTDEEQSKLLRDLFNKNWFYVLKNKGNDSFLKTVRYTIIKTTAPAMKSDFGLGEYKFEQYEKKGNGWRIRYPGELTDIVHISDQTAQQIISELTELANDPKSDPNAHVKITVTEGEAGTCTAETILYRGVNSSERLGRTEYIMHW